MCSLTEALEITNSHNVSQLVQDHISMKVYDIKCFTKNKELTMSTGYRKCPQKKISDIVHDLEHSDVRSLVTINYETKKNVKLYNGGYFSGKAPLDKINVLEKYYKNKDLIEKILLGGDILIIKVFSNYERTMHDTKLYKYVEDILYVKNTVKIIDYYSFCENPDRSIYDAIKFTLLQLLAGVPKKSTDMCKTYKILCDLTNVNVTDIIYDYLYV